MAAVSQLIGRGVGFAPGSTQYIPTLGLTVGAGIVLVRETITLQGRDDTRITLRGRNDTRITLTGEIG
jgi:hypothetical protein